MVEGKRKSRTLRRVFVRTPGRKTVKHYKKRKPGKPQCADCGKFLAGIPHLIASKLKKLPKTAKRPERPYGGELCSKCSRTRHVANARK